MNTIFDDCKQCDTADEKVNYLAGIVVNRLSTPRNDFYLKPVSYTHLTLPTKA